MHYDDTLDHIETPLLFDKALDKTIFKSNSTEVKTENQMNSQTEPIFSSSAVVIPENNENNTEVIAIKSEFPVVHHWLDPFLNSSNQLNEIKAEPVDNISTIESTPTETAPNKKPTKERKKYKRPSECKKYARFAITGTNDIVECDKCHKLLTRKQMPRHWQLHVNPKAFVCPVCKKAFDFKKYLNYHIRSYHSDNAKKHCCEFCSHRFYELGNLKNHIRIHTGEKPHTCEICGKAFNQSGSLKIHKRVHTQEKPYKCDYCYKQFNRNSSYWTHKRRHEKLTKFKCSTCGKEFVDKRNFERHNMIHTGERPFSCNVCNATFINKYTYNQHLLKHTDEKPHKCRFCHLTFTFSHSRRVHERKVHNDIKHMEKISYACNPHLLKHTVETPYKSCNVETNTEKFVNQNEFPQQPVLEQFSHNKTHFPIDEIKNNMIFKTNSTESQPKNPIYLQTTESLVPLPFAQKNKETKIESIENNAKKCMIQNEFLQEPVLHPFWNNSDYIEINDIKVEPADIQITSTTAPIENPTKQRKKYKRPSECKKYAWFAIVNTNDIVECDKCQKRLRKRQMLNHWKCHMNLKPLACPTCKRKFNLKRNLDRHILCVHSEKDKNNTKKYCCQYCSHRFHDLSNLKNHIRIHTGEKPYTCEVCGKAFNQSGALKIHKRVHTQEKPYQCDYCYKQFNSTSNYWTHRRRHDNVAQFKCSTCGKEFANKQDFNIHNITHTGERPFSCNVCNATFINKYTHNQHLLKHTGEKPYKCRFCHIAFTVAQSRRVHERTVHNDIKHAEKLSSFNTSLHAS